MAIPAILALLVAATSVSIIPRAMTVGGAQFTFHVPVSVSHLGSRYNQVQVLCAVLANQGDTNSLAESSVLKPLYNGAFSGKVDIGVNLPAGQDPSQAHYYVCKLILEGPNGVLDDPTIKFNPYDQPKPDTTAVVITQGKLP